MEIGRVEECSANLFLQKWRAKEKNFSDRSFQRKIPGHSPKKKWKKVRKTPLVEMTDGLQKESGFPTQIPVKQGEREADRGKVEQIVNKKIIKIQPPNSDVGSMGAGWGNFSVLYA